jgi:hypothetical protein
MIMLAFENNSVITRGGKTPTTAQLWLIGSVSNNKSRRQNGQGHIRMICQLTSCKGYVSEGPPTPIFKISYKTIIQHPVKQKYRNQNYEYQKL